MSRLDDINDNLEELGLRIAALQQQVRNLQNEKTQLEREALEQQRVKKLAKLSYAAQLVLFNMRKGWYVSSYGRYTGKNSSYEAINKQTLANLREGGFIEYEIGPLQRNSMGRNTLLSDKGCTCPLPKFD